LNIEQRNELVVRYIPVVKRIVRGLRLDASIQDDCIQAGHVSVIKQVDAWAAAHPAEDWDDEGHAMLEKSIRRDVLREKSRLESCGDVDIDALNDEYWAELGNFSSIDDSDGGGGVRVSGTLWSDAFVLPVVNDGNVDIEKQMTRDLLLERVKRLKPLPRRMVFGLLTGHTVSAMAVIMGLSQSAADRIYQKAVTDLQETLAGG